MDYNIYIHDSTGGGLGGYSSPTRAWTGGDGTFQTALDFQTLMTGDYRTSVGYANFKNGVSWLFAPAERAVDLIKTLTEQSIENSRKEQRRLLLGDSDINQYTGRGV